MTVALITGASIIIPQPALAAAVFPDTGMYATQSGSSNIVSVDLATGTTSLVLTLPGGVNGLNQIGLTNDGNKLLLTNGTSIFEYTASTESWETTARSTPAVPNTMGGVNPVNGIFYFGGQVSNGGNDFVFKTYNPATNTLSTSTIPVTADAPPGGNGDIAFDSLGNMYFVASSNAAAQIYRVDASQLTSSGGTATKVGPQIANGLALNSMAFAKDGFLYVAGTGANGFLRVNPITGKVLERKTLDVSITDLGSRSLPFTGSVRVDLPADRVKDTDQFTVTIGGGGISTGNTGTTTGTSDSKTVGPLLILPGETYTVEQTPAGTTNPDLYETSWKCVDPATGTVIASGSGTSGTFTIPQGVQNVSCGFTTAPYPAPDAVNDESLNNAQGSAVKVPVLGNDKGDLDPTTVKLLDADKKPVTELVVPGQGTWTVDPATGAVTFTPEAGFTANPTPVTYQVTDVRGNNTQATNTITYLPGAVNDESLNNAQGSAVKVPVLGNDKGDLDPTTVKLLDADKKPVTELVVPGQGTWTVDPATGAVTFTPEAGFTANPTPVTYQVTDVRGNNTQATNTITYLPGAVNDESLNNAQGSAVKVPVLGNDKGDLDPTTVKLLDADKKPVTELVVPGQGTWTVDPATGAVTFTPEAGFTANPTPVTYQVTDVRGNNTQATNTITYLPGAVNDESLNNAQGSAVKVPVLGNDKGDLDPTTVKLLDADKKPVTELVVPGQGTWTVDPATGAVTFTPEAGFTANPTPVTYQVTDVRGNNTQATNTITYLPGAVNDESLNNAQGSAVKVPVLGNDKGDLDPTTVKLLDADKKPVTELVVPGQGTWTVDPATGAVTFTPEAGFTANPTPVTYQVTDVRGNNTQATNTVTYLPGAVNDESLNNAQGSAVKVPVLGNDKGDLDPTTVKLLDADKKPVTELVVPGQGTWTVDPATGAVTFTPEAGFTANPTPVTYQVTDVRGNNTQATITVTYLPGAVTPSAPATGTSNAPLASTGAQVFGFGIAGLAIALMGAVLLITRRRRMNG